ncbi:MAG TPA: hypothetical protein VN040_14115 [Pseudosphingobacterium sp.]|nr:hypothetical protein [Pseudosphingobacterium sp.]
MKRITNYLLKCSFLLAVLAMLISCKEKDFMGSPDQTKGSRHLQLSKEGEAVKENYSWLYFPSMEVFKVTMSDLHTKYEKPGMLATWEKQFGNFISLRNAYERIDADTSEERRAPTVDSLIRSNQLLDCPDSFFATVINKDGYIQIADTIYSFKPGMEKGEAFAIPDKYIGEVLKGTPVRELDDVKTHYTSFIRIPFIRWWESGENSLDLRLPICFYPSGSMGNWWGQSGDDIYAGDDGQVFPEHNGRQVRLNYHRWRVGYIFYASTGVRVKMWKHTRFAGWQSVTYADEMIMEACCKGNVLIPGFAPIGFNERTSPDWPYFARHAENNFEKTLKWTANGIFNEIMLEHFNFHFKVNYRGRIVERNIRQ